jgi:molybdenum-dependent DNA-binding transcriptional regulator ModE
VRPPNEPPDAAPELAPREFHGIAHPKKAAMLAALARTGNVSASARAAKLSTPGAAI